ncbi:MAG: hypothetical protein M3O84_01720 [Actinomycetota bacterium]|nr:hypothetical protein [Actinomycetota bacterium]
MSDRLKQGLASSKTEIEAGLAEAEAELARGRQRCRELEELIALGKATLLAAQMSTAARSGTVERMAAELGNEPGGDKSASELAARLGKAVQK